jgi:Putative mono-oxygenase ydhR
MPRILQINYKLSSSVSSFMKESNPVADALAAVAGLRWKIWLVNEAEQEGGGIYLFDDSAALEGFLKGPLVARLKAHPGLREIQIKKFDAWEELTKVTRGPV